jgi:hypothetical protein
LIVEREVVGLEEEMRRRFGYGGRYIDAHVSARCLCGKRKVGEMYEWRGRKREREQTVHHR